MLMKRKPRKKLKASNYSDSLCTCDSSVLVFVFWSLPVPKALLVYGVAMEFQSILQQSFFLQFGILENTMPLNFVLLNHCVLV
jgi:hypothetical protein